MIPYHRTSENINAESFGKKREEIINLRNLKRRKLNAKQTVTEESTVRAEFLSNGVLFFIIHHNNEKPNYLFLLIDSENVVNVKLIRSSKMTHFHLS